MEFYEENQKQQKLTERFVLILFTIYILNMSFRTFSESWPFWVPFTMLVFLSIAWVLFLKQYKNFATRALVTSILMSFCILLYGQYTLDFFGCITTFFVFSIIISLFGIAEYICINLFVGLMLFINYAINLGDDLFVNNNFKSIALQCTNVIFLQLLLFYLVRRNSKNAQQTLKTIDALKRMERGKDDFLANVSHEIRTPLNTILGMSDMMLDESDVDVIHEYVYNIQTAGRNLMSTVSDILDFSELQAGEITLNEEAYNLAASVKDIVNMATALRDEKDIEIIVDYDATLPSVLYGDEKKLRRIIMNLVSNAIKFTRDGGIRITVKGRKEDYGLNLCISVSDTGIGMNAENMEMLFTSFSQIDTRRNRQNGGIGLGLAISKALVDKMGGTILISSELGKGSVLQIVVPQKIVDETPAIDVAEKEENHMLVYFNLEQFKFREIRDAYNENLNNIIGQLGVSFHICRSLSELKRRMGREQHSHLLISEFEYFEDKEYFDSIVNTTHMMIVLDRKDDKNIGDEICKVYKPISVLSIVSALDCFNRNMGLEHGIGYDSGKEASRLVCPTSKILVVDDNLMNIRVVEGLLSKYEICVEYALSGMEALDKIESMDYDFIFMDHMMPEMDGVETAHRIRNKVGSYYQAVPIIALTANAIAGSREMFLSEGFADFVEKPLEASVLDWIIRRYIPESKFEYPEEIVFAENKKVKEELTHNEEIIINQDSLHNDSIESVMQIKELDTSSGSIYCGGEDTYQMILEEFCETAVETRRELNDLFEKQDWANYTIKIHALKSSMKTIGANKLSEQALELELAGKEGNYDLIVEKHAEVMHVHEVLFMRLVTYDVLRESLDEKVIEENLNPDYHEITLEQNSEPLLEITKSEFEKILEEFEVATYNLDSDALLNLVERIENRQCMENDLSDLVRKVRKKVTQDDYFSAHEMLLSFYERMDS